MAGNLCAPSRSCSIWESRLWWSRCSRRSTLPFGRTLSSWPRRERRTLRKVFRCKSYAVSQWKKSTKKSSQNNHISQGALTAVSELERGHQDVVDSIQCVAYTLGAGGISESQAKSKLERALLRISKPVSWLSLQYPSTWIAGLNIRMWLILIIVRAQVATKAKLFFINNHHLITWLKSWGNEL